MSVNQDPSELPTLTSVLERNGGRYRLGYPDREREVLLTIPYHMSK